MERENRLKVTGYADRWSLHPGGTLSVCASCDAPFFNVELRRLVHGDPNPDGPGVKEEVVAHPINGRRLPGAVRAIPTGSCVRVPRLPDSTTIAITGSFKPTLPGASMQAILGLRLGDEHLVVTLDGARLGISTKAGLHAEAKGMIEDTSWRDFLLVLDSAGQHARFHCRPTAFTPVGADGEVLEIPFQAAARSSDSMLTFAAAGAKQMGKQWQVDRPFNGRLADLKLYASAAATGALEASWAARRPADVRPTSAWDFVQHAETGRVADPMGGFDGHSINRPTRLVTGPRFTARTLSPFEAPDEFNAAHFHDDDLEDAGWPTSFTFQAPENLRSGTYAFRLTCEGGEDYVPFFVTPAPGEQRTRVAVLMPTLSYQVYANMHADASLLPEEIVPLANRDPEWSPEEAYIRANRLASCYDVHSDGSGICMATAARPMPVFVRPRSASRFNNAPHQLSADLYLTDWLEEVGINYELITDHELHAHGAAALAPYNVVISGTHAEYWTAEMLAALRAYQLEGGRFVCLSGNSLYWATSLSADGKLVEVRRDHGLRSWTAAPGEAYMSLSGTRGGIWRDLGHAAQQYIGVGMTAMGFDLGQGYRRRPESYSSRAAFLFEGIDDDVIGDFPVLVSAHGAAGYEIDRADFELGTPPHALVLASATGFSDSYQLVVDDVFSTSPHFGGQYQPNVRADIVFYETPNNGAVFSTGSIAWCSGLSFNQYRNNVSRLTENVIRSFMKDGPLDLVAQEQDEICAQMRIER